jgi:hypothetical protein
VEVKSQMRMLEAYVRTLLNQGEQQPTGSSSKTDGISPFQPVKGNWKAGTFLNCNCISPESPGRRLIGEIEFSFCLGRAYGCAVGVD